MANSNSVSLSGGLMSYANYTPSQCFQFPPEEQVSCSAQMLNSTNPPSEYSFVQDTTLWEPIWCLLYNVSLTNRVEAFDGKFLSLTNSCSFNYCSVPLRGSDGFLFVSLALLATAMLFGKLAVVWVLIVGGVLGTLNYYFNLLQISNAVSIWLSIQPADLFFYAFLPPLLVEQAIRIDFFMFGKIWVHSIYMAFVMVVLSTIALTPFILFVLGFINRGWSWVHGAIFSAIIAPTDALAVAAILARANGPERIVAIMEGESLFNDASAITLFEVFLHFIEDYTHDAETGWPSVWSVIPTIIVDILRLSAIGFGIGIGFSWVTGYILRWLRWRGARPYIETTVVLAVAYLSFYVATSPAKGSGVIAVVVFGLYGNATSKWGMLGSAEESGAFDAVWDMISFAANGLVFFWSGVASINFTIRSIAMFPRTVWSYVAVIFIYIFMLVVRTICMAIGNPLFLAVGEGLSAAEIFFVGWSGLRGSVSLIMVSAFTTGASLTFETNETNGMGAVNADISLWSSLFVVLTLVINGPGIAPILKLLRLDHVPLGKRKMRAKAKRALRRFTEEQLLQLREDDDEFLQGANWDAVAQYVDMSKYFKSEEESLKQDIAREKERLKRSNGDAKDDVQTAWGVTRVLFRGMLSGIAGWCTCCTGNVKKVAHSLNRKSMMMPHQLSGASSTDTKAGGGGGSGGVHPSTAAAAPLHGILKKKAKENISDDTGTLHQSNAPVIQDATAMSNISPPLSATVDNSSLSLQQNIQGHYPRLSRQSVWHTTSKDPDLDSGDENIDQHDAWSDVSAQELLHELEEECPFLPGKHGDARQAIKDDYEKVLTRNGSSPDEDGPDLEAGGGSGAMIVELPPQESQGAMNIDAAAGDAGSGDAPGDMTSPVRKVRSGSSLETITEGKVAHHLETGLSGIGSINAPNKEEDDQACVTGSSGAKLLVELRKSLKHSESNVQVETMALPVLNQPNDIPDYYATVPESLGVAMKQQLSAELAVGGASAQQNQAIAAEESPAYYCSLPTVVGASLQQQLKQALLEQQQQHKDDKIQTDNAAIPATDTGPPPQQQQQSLQLSEDATITGYYTSLPITSRSSLQDELRKEMKKTPPTLRDSLQRYGSKTLQSSGASAPSSPPAPSLSPSSSYNSVPSVLGRSMKARLQVIQQQQQQQQRGSSVSPTESPRARLDRLSSYSQHSSDGGPSSAVHTEWDSYHATVSGVLGSNLAAEVRQHVQHPPEQGVGFTHDLLGRKMVVKKKVHERTGSFGRTLPPLPPSTGSNAPSIPSSSMMVPPPAGASGGLVSATPAQTPLASALLRTRSHQHSLPRRRNPQAVTSTGNGADVEMTDGGNGMASVGYTTTTLTATPGGNSSRDANASLLQQQQPAAMLPGQRSFMLGRRSLQRNFNSLQLRDSTGAVDSSQHHFDTQEQGFLARQQFSPSGSGDSSALRGNISSPFNNNSNVDSILPGSSSFRLVQPTPSPLPVAPTNSAALLLSRTFSMGSSLSRMSSFRRPGSGKKEDSRGVASSKTLDDDNVPVDGEYLLGMNDDGFTPAGIIINNTRSEEADDNHNMNDASSWSTNTIDDDAYDKERGEPHATKYGVGEEDDLAEMRSRLLAGLKRHFVGKRLAGLLSVAGLRILTYGCDRAADSAAEPLRLWSALEREVSGRWLTRWASRMSLATTRAYRALPKFLRKVFSWPFKKFAGVLRRYLGRRMLIACEVAVEYYLALTWSPQIQWLKTHADECWLLLDEVEAEAEAAYRFIIEREIEAPDRFQAIQSYRAAMAILRQQLLFVDELFESGMLDEGEHHDMSDPVDKRMRRLEIVGPVWRPPHPKQVLRRLSFMESLPDDVFKNIWGSGELKEFRSGQCIWSASNLVKKTDGMQGPGGFVVLSGVVKRVYIRPDGTKKEYYQGAGGVVGVLLSMTGTKLPGTELALAEGNSLGKGPIVFHIPQPYIHQFIIQGARSGDEVMIGLEHELLRLSAAYVLESTEIDMMNDIVQHVTLILSSSHAGKMHHGAHKRKTFTGPATSASAPILLARSSSFLDPSMPPPSSTPSATRPAANTATAATTLTSRRSASEGAVLQSLGSTPILGSGSSNDIGTVEYLQRRSTVNLPGYAATMTSAGGGTVQQQQGVGTGLVTSKSVGANLALITRIAQEIEYDDSGDEFSRHDGSDNDFDSDDEAYHAREMPRSVMATDKSAVINTAASVTDGDGKRKDDGSVPAIKKKEREKTNGSPRRLTRVSMMYNPNQGANLAAVMQRAPQLAAEVMIEIRRGLHVAFVMRLDPEVEFIQMSHMVLIAGDVIETNDETPSANSSGDDGGGETTAKQPGGLLRSVGAPRVLPWLWESHQLCNLGAGIEMKSSTRWKVGQEGAMLVVCHTADGSVPDCIYDYQEMVEERQRAQRAVQLASFPLSSSSPKGDVTGDHAAQTVRFQNPQAVMDDGSSSVGGPSTATPPESENNSIMGAAAMHMGRELGSMLSRLRRVRTAPASRGGDAQGNNI